MKKVTSSQIKREFRRDLIVHGIIVAVVLFFLYLSWKYAPEIDVMGSHINHLLK